MDAINKSRLVGAAADMLKQRFTDCIEISRLEKEAEATGTLSTFAVRTCCIANDELIMRPPAGSLRSFVPALSCQLERCFLPPI